MHSDGSIMSLLPCIAESGIDILNPIQWTTKNMDPQTLKDRFGNDFIFWGGGVDLQGILPFRTPEEVHEEVKTHLKIFRQEVDMCLPPSIMHNPVCQLKTCWHFTKQ